MPTYRAPSEILWVNDGWKETKAHTIDEALATFRDLGMTLTLANLQVKIGNDWHFASEVAGHFGGYNRRGEG